MASGMTNSTARPDLGCVGWRREVTGLRIEGGCGFVALPAFGMLAFDWSARTLSLQVRGATGGGPVLQEVTISLKTCLPL